MPKRYSVVEDGLSYCLVKDGQIFARSNAEDNFTGLRGEFKRIAALLNDDELENLVLSTAQSEGCRDTQDSQGKLLPELPLPRLPWHFKFNVQIGKSQDDGTRTLTAGSTSLPGEVVLGGNEEELEQDAERIVIDAYRRREGISVMAIACCSLGEKKLLVGVKPYRDKE